MRLLLLLLFSGTTLLSVAQDHGFPYGQTTYRELDMKVYEKDTAAVAVVLNEFGEAYIDNSNDNNLLFEYHTKIKILKKGGLSQADFQIPLRKGESRSERVRSVKASSFNYENGSMKETRLENKNLFTENLSKYWDMSKFAVPNVRVGSVIEVHYIVESPFIFNFHNWEFQADIPKVMSEYWATVPANYKFNISLKGYLQLSKNESELIRDCFTPGGGYNADCARFKWA